MVCFSVVKFPEIDTFANGTHAHFKDGTYRHIGELYSKEHNELVYVYSKNRQSWHTIATIL